MPFNDDFDTELEQQSASAGVDVNVLRAFHGAENSGQLSARVNPASGAVGPFQFIQNTWDGLAVSAPSLNLTDRFNPVQQARAAPWLLKSYNDVLTKSLGRAPTTSEQYAGWFLGPTGASKVLTASDDTPIQAVVSPAAYAQNQSVFSQAPTVGEFKTWASGKVGGPAIAPVANQAFAKAQKAVDEAFTKLGEVEGVNRSDLMDYMRTGGVNLDPVQSASRMGGADLGPDVRKEDSQVSDSLNLQSACAFRRTAQRRALRAKKDRAREAFIAALTAAFEGYVTAVTQAGLEITPPRWRWH